MHFFLGALRVNSACQVIFHALTFFKLNFSKNLSGTSSESFKLGIVNGLPLFWKYSVDGFWKSCTYTVNPYQGLGF